MLSRFFRKKEVVRRYPLVQQVVVNSGLAAVDGVEHPHDLAGLALVPPFAQFWSSFSNEEKSKLIKNYLAIYIHNMLNADDYPLEEALVEHLVNLENTIDDLKDNAWRDLLMSYGATGEVPTKKSFVNLEPTEQLALAGDRTEWEEKVSPILGRIIDWINNNSQVEAWHSRRLQLFE